MRNQYAKAVYFSDTGVGLYRLDAVKVVCIYGGRGSS